MCNISGRTNRALLVIDVQNDVVAGNFERDLRCQNIAQLVANARQSDTPVIWVQHNDDELVRNTPGWDLVPELLPEPGEAVIHKNFRSSFENTDLDAVLAEQGVAELIVCGSQTNYCVRNTVHAALERGYDVTLVSDAHTTCDEHTEHLVIPAQHIVEEFNRVSEHYELPGRQLRTVTTSSILAL